MVIIQNELSQFCQMDHGKDDKVSSSLTVSLNNIGTTMKCQALC